MWKAPEKIAANDCGPISLHRDVGMTNGSHAARSFKFDRIEQARYSVVP
jgi:hypothetical protein